MEKREKTEILEKLLASAEPSDVGKLLSALISALNEK